MKIENGKIKSTGLGPSANDGRGFGAWLHIEFNGSGQGFGGYALDTYLEKQDRRDNYDRVGTAWGMEYIRRLLDTLEVGTWEELPDTHVRVRRTTDGWGGSIEAIGHIMKDQWFQPGEDLKFLLDENGFTK